MAPNVAKPTGLLVAARIVANEATLLSMKTTYNNIGIKSAYCTLNNSLQIPQTQFKANWDSYDYSQFYNSFIRTMGDDGESAYGDNIIAYDEYHDHAIMWFDLRLSSISASSRLLKGFCTTKGFWYT